MAKSKFESYPVDVLKLLIELLNENMSETKFSHKNFNELYPHRSDDIVKTLKMSASQFGESNLSLSDLEYLLVLWGLNPDFKDGNDIIMPKLHKFEVSTRVNLKQYVREEWETTYNTYLNEEQLQLNLEEYENNWWEGDMMYSEIQDSNTLETDITDIHEISINESKRKINILEEFDKNKDNISNLNKLKIIIENRINYLSSK
jgi:hypothetical protein